MRLLQINNQVQEGIHFLERIQNELIGFVPKAAGAILLFLVGNWLIKKIVLAANKVFQNRNFDPSLRTFLGSSIRVSLMILLLLSIAGVIGINITGFAALLAGAGLAIGSALNGSLGNLAGGVMILLFKPFRVGDFIEAQGSIGEVTEIGIFNTFVLTPERKTVILPNGGLSTGVITNYTTSGSLRVDIPISIAPNMSIEKTRQVAIEAMKRHPLVLPDPGPEVVVTKIGDGMITLSLRPSTLQVNYPTVFVEIQEMVKNAFDAHDIEMPVPHRIILNKG